MGYTFPFPYFCSMGVDQLTKTLFDRVCRENCIQSYNELFLSCSSRLIHLSAGIVASFPLAEEVVSDVFLALWHKRNQLTHVHNPLVYLYVSTKNLSLNMLKQQRRNQHHYLEAIDPEMFAVAPEAESDMISAEVHQKIEAAIRSLPARCQLIFRLVKHDHLSYRDVAELLEISPKTVDAQLTLAVKKISQAIRFDLSEDVARSYLQGNS